MDLLVSVRSVPEALAALAGGAGLIDVKEPRAGSLGRPAEETVRAVVRAVAGRRPVSAALGELLEAPSPPSVSGITFGKWGLASCGAHLSWREQLAAAGRRLTEVNPGCRPVAAAYADWQRAAAPPPGDVIGFVREHGWGVLLLDTRGKDGTTLLDWLAPVDLGRLRERCAASGIRVALAGSLGGEQIRSLMPLAPDWFAVRGAVCRGGRRSAPISESAVRRLVDLLRPAAIPGSSPHE